jgi:hypothetical protein
MEPMLTEERLRSLIALVGEIVEQGKTFKVFPPAEVTQDPDVLDRNDAAAKLLGTKWWVRFADGGEQLLTFPELMIVTHNLIAVMTQVRQREQAGENASPVSISVPNLMSPETVRFLLSKLEMEGVTRERYIPSFPLFGVHQGEAEGKLQLQGCSDPNTGLDLLFVFTEQALADRFAEQIPGASSVLVAASHDDLKALLRTSPARAVAFDPVLSGGKLQARHTVLVPAILSA